MRIFRLIATPVILLGLLGFLGWGFMWGWRELTAPIPTTPPTPCVEMESDIVTPAMVSVRVYNGGYTTGLARRIGTFLGDSGFIVARVDDTEEQVKETEVRGSLREQPMMRLVASRFLEPKLVYDERITGDVDVVVGSGWQGFAPVEQHIYQVSSGGTVCRPPQPSDESPSPSPSPTPES